MTGGNKTRLQDGLVLRCVTAWDSGQVLQAGLRRVLVLVLGACRESGLDALQYTIRHGQMVKKP